MTDHGFPWDQDAPEPSWHLPFSSGRVQVCDLYKIADIVRDKSSTTRELVDASELSSEAVHVGLKQLRERGIVEFDRNSMNWAYVEPHLRS